MPAGVIVVVAAVIERDDRFLLTLRPAGVALSRATGSFPAASVFRLKPTAEALRRELHEELDIVGDIEDCIYV